MKAFFYSLLLSTILVTPAWATSHMDEAGNDEHGIKIQVELDDDENGDVEITEEELERKIKGKVLSLIADVIDAAGEGLSEDKKSEIKSEIKEAIEDVKDIKNDEKFGHNIHIGSNGPDFMEAVIPILAIFLIFGTPIMIIAAVLYSSYRKKRLMHDTINQYVTSGKDIPDEVLKGLQKEATPKSNLHRGLVMSGIGLGIFACFAVIGSLEAAAIGLIPLFIGLAQLLIWKLESK